MFKLLYQNLKTTKNQVSIQEMIFNRTMAQTQPTSPQSLIKPSWMKTVFLLLEMVKNTDDLVQEKEEISSLRMWNWRQERITLFCEEHLQLRLVVNSYNYDKCLVILFFTWPHLINIYSYNYRLYVLWADWHADRMIIYKCVPLEVFLWFDYLTIRGRRRADYKPTFTDPKAKWIYVVIADAEATNCFSINFQVFTNDNRLNITKIHFKFSTVWKSKNEKTIVTGQWRSLQRQRILTNKNAGKSVASIRLQKTLIVQNTIIWVCPPHLSRWRRHWGKLIVTWKFILIVYSQCNQNHKKICQVNFGSHLS